MTDRRGSRLVYSTGKGQICSGCGWPIDDCTCSRGGTESVPQRIVAKLRVEKSGRGGKTVTVIGGLPRNDAFLKSLCAELKRACGAGGSAGEDSVEIQGDLRERIRSLLTAKGFLVKG